jgi:hypothetical protein
MNRRVKIFSALSISFIVAACASAEDSGKGAGSGDADASAETTETDESVNESISDDSNQIPADLQETVDALWANSLEIQAIYCDCDADGDLCEQIEPEDDEALQACSVAALALNPEGSREPLECDLWVGERELKCLQDAGSCEMIENPPDNAETCDIKAAWDIDTCPPYPDPVWDAIEACSDEVESRGVRRRVGARPGQLARFRFR